ncbi:19707_t:CDS:1 [Funneliformis geosporum]|nr:19707_t:CDS:1 [Funneliformis geosporum]
MSSSRAPNIFIAYRKEMMKIKPDNMTMPEYSKMIAELWRQMPEEDKINRKRVYQIFRDQKLPNAVDKRMNKSSEIVPSVSFHMGESLESFPSMPDCKFNRHQILQNAGPINENSDSNLTVDQFNQYQTPSEMNVAGQMRQFSDSEVLMAIYQFKQDNH